MKTVIMAGGKGTRISSVASDIPKPMIKIEGEPVLEREIECLRDQGFTDQIITVSHLSEQIINDEGLTEPRFRNNSISSIVAVHAIAPEFVDILFREHLSLVPEDSNSLP